MNISIRNGNEADLPTVMQFIIDLARFEKAEDDVLNSLEKMKREQDYFDCLLAETADGEIVGMALYFFGYFTWRGKTLYLDDLYVVPECRGQGVGSLLLERIRQEAAEQKCSEIRFQVLEWNTKAIEVYKKIGTRFDTGWLNCRLPVADQA